MPMSLRSLAHISMAAVVLSASTTDSLSVSQSLARCELSLLTHNLATFSLHTISRSMVCARFVSLHVLGLSLFPLCAALQSWDRLCLLFFVLLCSSRSRARSCWVLDVFAVSCLVMLTLRCPLQASRAQNRQRRLSI